VGAVREGGLLAGTFLIKSAIPKLSITLLKRYGSGELALVVFSNLLASLRW